MEFTAAVLWVEVSLRRTCFLHLPALRLLCRPHPGSSLAITTSLTEFLLKTPRRTIEVGPVFLLLLLLPVTLRITMPAPQGCTRPHTLTCPRQAPCTSLRPWLNETGTGSGTGDREIGTGSVTETLGGAMARLVAPLTITNRM